MLSKHVVRKSRKVMTKMLVAILGVSLFVPILPQTTVEAAPTPVVPLLFSAPEDIGPMVTSPKASDAVFGVEDGKQVMYTTVTGDPGIFSVVDMENYSLIRTVPLPEGGSSNSHVIDSKGQVYIGSKNGLYRYSPVTKQAERLAGIAGASELYGLSVDEHDNIYGGTFPTASIFKYDTTANKLTVFGRISEGKDYIRAVAYYDGYLYAGTGAVGELYKVNPNDGSKALIPFPNVPQYTEEKVMQLYSISIVRNYMFILLSSQRLLIYDLDAQAWLPEWSSVEDLDRYYRGMNVSPELDGKVYLGMEGKIQTFDLETREITPTNLEFSTYLRQPGWVEMNDPELPGKSLATVLTNGGISVLNFTTNTVKTFEPVVPGTPVSIQSLELGPEGLLYSSGYLGAYGARYNIETGNKELFSMGQAEGMAPYGNKMMFGVYPASFIHELDTTLPLERNINPKIIHQIEDQQDRPFVMVTGDDLLFSGTIPKLGELGGALTIYDGSTWETHRNVVQNQSIMGLAYRKGAVKGEGLIYGSTTVWGGLGIEPSEPEAKMFVWDVKTKKVIKEFTPAIQQAGGVKPKAIGGLSFGPDGLLWGAAYGTLFAMNPDTYEIVKQKEIISTNWVFGHYWVPVKLRWDKDGFLFTTLGSTVTVVDPKTMAHVTIPGTKTNLMVVGKDGNIYYNEAAILKKITVTPGNPPTYVDVEIPIVNGNFEEVNQDGTIPGWEQLASHTSAANYEVTNEKSNEGTRSLKITDTSIEAETGVISAPFPVTPGLEYKGKADIYLNSGRTIFAMRYYDSEGKEIKLTPAPANYFSSPTGQWAQAEFSSMAPEGAVTGKLVLFCSLAWVGTAYFDNVKVFKKMITDAPPAGPVTQELDVVNAGFEQPLNANGTIPGWLIRKPETFVGKQAAIEVSTDQAKSGSKSLRLFDNETALEVAVDSGLVPVIGGRTYTSSMDVFRTSNPPGRTSNRPILQVRYHDATGKEMAVVPGVTMSKEVTTTINQWGNVSLTTPAPASAKFIRLIMVGATAFVASVYVDNASVATVVAPEERTELTLRREPVTNVTEGTDITFNVTATNGSTIMVKEGDLIVAQASGAGEDTPVTVTIPGPAAGAHNYKVYAHVTGLGKSTTIELPLVTVQADQTAPTITIDGVAEAKDYTDTVMPTVVVSDQGSGVKQLTVLLDGEPWTEGTAVTAAGAHTLSVTAVDKAGNSATKEIHFSLYTSTILTVDNAVGVYSDATQLNAKLMDRSGAPITNETITFQVNGEVVATAQTDTQGQAAAMYTVAVGTKNTTNEPYGISAVYNQNDSKFLRGTSNTALLTVSKENATVAYTGDRQAVEAGPLLLAAQVQQEQDGSLGKLDGLPIRFVVQSIGMDGSRVPVVVPGLQEIYTTDSQGNVSVHVSLPAGLYDVRTELVENRNYINASVVTELAVSNKNDIEVKINGFIHLPGDTMFGRIGDKLHFDVKLSQEKKDRWRMRVEPKGFDVDITAVDWVIVSEGSAYLQGTKRVDGEDYTVRLIVSEGGEGQKEAVSIQVWNGNEPTGTPLINLTAELSGEIKIGK